MKLLVPITGIFVIAMTFFLFYDQKVVIPVGKNTTTPTSVPATLTPEIIVKVPPSQAIILQGLHVYQTFNNCGPASLAMLLSYNNYNVSQQELGLKLRPYQNPQGDNDDKSVTVSELAEESKNYNLIPYYRPNGRIDLLKKLVANGFPVLVRTLLHPQEDIGHYRIVRGYDDTTQEIIQDDSYEGGDLRFSYEEFYAMWQPFNYEYLIIAKPSQKQLAEAIIADEVSEETAWEHAYDRAIKEQNENSENINTIFNRSVALYHLGRYEESISAFESVRNQLSSRVLWYQIQPIQSYLENKQYDEVFILTGSILNNYNRGFTELYLLRGRAYKEQGNIEGARNEFQLAIFYNQNSEEAKKALNKL